jgi:hypothetical protein
VGTKRDEASLLIKRASGGTLKLNFSGFSKLFDPRNPEASQALFARTGVGRLDFMPDTEALIHSVLSLLLEQEIATERFRQQVSTSPNFNLEEVFQNLDKMRSGSVTL